jgi:iron complex outermembrane recepter protein
MTYKTALLRSACAFAAFSVFAADSAHAQTHESAVIEEVVVTARKREESLQTIPVAVTAASAEQLAHQGIRQPTDLSATVPSLQISASTSTGASGATISLRGQSMGDVLLTLSPPVGLYIDNVNVPHPMGANVSFFDLSRVEVLKGPQGTLYGRNTTAGAINVITKGADFNGLHGFVEGEYGNFKSWRGAAAVNIPIMEDMLAARLAYQHWGRDGYGKSVVTGQKLGGDRKDDIARLSVNFQPTPYLSAVLKAEYAKADRAGLLYTVASFNRTSPLAAAALNEETFYTGLPGGRGPYTLATTRTRDDVKTKHLGFDVNWDITDNVRLRSLTGYHWFETFRVFDLDATPYQIGENGAVPDVGAARPPAGARLPDGTLATGGPYGLPFALRPDQTSGQWTQEFNLSGAAYDDRFNWLVGAFYSIDRGDGAQLSVKQPATQIGRLAAGSFYAPNIPVFDGEHVNISTAALFTQNDFKFNDVVSITLGARYTEERMKQLNGAWTYDQNFQHAATLSGPGQNFRCSTGPFAATVDYQSDPLACAITQSAKYSGTSYLASLNLQFTPDILTYFKISRGFRGGALQFRAPNSPAVRPEVADDYEIGFKGEFFGRRLRTNISAYQTNYANQQSSVIVFLPDGVTRTTVLQNASEARLRGVELEWRVVPPIEGLLLYGNLGYLDAAYLSFNNALVTGGLITDRSGEPLEVPEWTGNVGARYELDLGPGRLGLQGDYAYKGKTPLTSSNRVGADAAAIKAMEEYRKAIGLVNARLDYELADMGVTVSVWSTNLLNKHYQISSIGLTANSALVTGITQEPRMYGVTVRKRFGGE